METKTVLIRFGDVTASELNTTLTAASEGGQEIATRIIDNQIGNNWFSLTEPEAEYMIDILYGDADRVSQACGDAAGRAFERAGEKLDSLFVKTFGRAPSKI